MIVRAEQMEAFESAAEDNFVARLGEHLRENYGESVVRLPDQESAVSELPKETLEPLIRRSIDRARSHGLTFESAISGFSAVMFDVAPNFDEHSVAKLCLKDKQIDPNDRLNEVLTLLTDEHWEKIRDDYDVNAWAEDRTAEAESEPGADAESSATPDPAATIIDSPKKDVRTAEVPEGDFAATVMNVDAPRTPPKSEAAPEVKFIKPEAEKAEKSKQPVNLDNINWDATMIGVDPGKKAAKVPKDKGLDLDATVINIDKE
jgi:hypothetical protein